MGYPTNYHAAFSATSKTPRQLEPSFATGSGRVCRSCKTGIACETSAYKKKKCDKRLHKESSNEYVLELLHAASRLVHRGVRFRDLATTATMKSLRFSLRANRYLDFLTIQSIKAAQ